MIVKEKIRRGPGMSSDEIANQHIQLEIEKAAWDKKQEEKKTEIQHVKITGINVPFFQLVWFLTTLAFAAVPAIIIVVVAYSTLISAIVGNL
jgi:hypothetical protein